MAERPKIWGYIVTVFKRSLMGFDSANRLITIVSYIAIIVISVVALDPIEEFLGDKIEGDKIEKLFSYVAIAWLVLLFLVISPYRVWADEKHKILQIEEANNPRIHIGWRFNDPNAELIVTNQSARTLTGIDVMFRNYRKADGSDIRDVLRSLVSNDGKQPPINLNPLVPTYFRFSQLQLIQVGGTASIVVTSEDGEEKWLGQEAGIKLGISGIDIVNSRVDLRLTVKDNKEITIESWEAGKNAVGIWEGEG